MASAARDIPGAMQALKISTNPKSKPKPKESDVADSWEDEAEDDAPTPTTDPSTAEGSAVGSPDGFDALSRTSTNFNPHPPPPTPASPTQGAFSYPDLASNTRFPGLAKTTSNTVSQQPGSGNSTPNRSRTHSAVNSGTSTPSDRRPDKTTSTATRLIAAGLGMKVPKRTEAEREYDRVSRENERKKKEREREEAKRKEVEAQKAKESVWDD